MKFINNFESSESLFTGNPNISIPLYNIELKNLNIPITIGYNSTGLKVNQGKPNIGYGWILTSGGQITRVMNKLPDDIKRVYRKMVGDGVREQFDVGFLYNGGQRAEIMYDSEYNDWDIENNGCLDYIYYAGFNALDTEPDEFIINAPGINSKFYFDNNGNPQAVSSPGLKIETNISEPENGEITSFNVIDLEGNKLIFDKIERTSVYNTSISDILLDVWLDNHDKAFGDPFYDWFEVYSGQELLDSLDGISYISTWHLSKIITPNNEIIEFNYLSLIGVTDETSINYALHKELPQIEEYEPIVFGNLVKNTKQILWGITWSNFNIKFSYHDNIALIKHFTVNDTKCNKIIGWNFDHSTYTSDNSIIDYESLHFGENEMQDYTTWFKLNNIYKFSASGEIDNRLLNGTEKLHTDLIGVQNQNFKYSFSYNEDYPMPNKAASTRDFWGYYNNKSEENSIPTLFDVDPESLNDSKADFAFFSLFNDEMNTYPTFYQGADRSSNPQYMKAGILKKIVYPTQGSVEFEYDLNTFRYKSRTLAGGGLRISKITLYPINSSPIIKNYTYLDTENNWSSGKLLDLPIYHYDEPFRKILTTYDINSCKVIHGSYVGYSEVTVETPGQGKTTYSFDFPMPLEVDSYISNTGNFSYERPEAVIVKDRLNDNITPINTLLPMTNTSWNHGQVTKIINKDNSNNTISQIEKAYKEIKKMEIPYIYCKNKTTLSCASCHNMPGPLFNIDFLVGKLKKIIASKVVSELKVSTCDNNSTNNCIVDKTTNEYDDFNQIRCETKILSNNDIMMTKYYYPSDIIEPSEVYMTVEIINKMIENNYLNRVIKKERFINNVQVEGEIYSYEMFHNNEKLILPSVKRIYSYPNYKINSYMSYDDFGNLLQNQKVDDITTTFIWGFNKTYPIARIENASYQLVVAELLELGFSETSLQDKTESELRQIFLLLRQRPNLSSALITSYTYLPLFGVSSETDPSGNCKYYEYDVSGRLLYIKNNQGEYLEKFDYHYK